MTTRRIGPWMHTGLWLLMATGLAAAPAEHENSRDDVHAGPVLESFGWHVDLPDADFPTPKDQVFKVAFELLQPLGPPDKAHMRLEAAARFLNMHVHAGIPRENVHLTLILHGGGTYAAMSNEAYRKKYGVDNPNLPLLDALAGAGVDIYLCEQSRVLNGLAKSDIAAPVQSALSAMTAVVSLQAQGYQFLRY